MIKYALLLANLLGVFAIGTLLDDGVIIEDNTPSVLAPGEEVAVEISVNKGSVEGFAKLQVELPEGLTASAIETNGASFTFSGQKVKFIWMSLPEDQEFTVAYKLKASANASGNKVITGAFSYIKENQRVDYDMQTKMIEITGAAGDDIATESPVSGLGVEGMACVRTTTEMGNGKYLVRLDVVNSSLQGFAKIKEMIPSGFTASEDDSDGAVVTIESDAIKYVWFDAPTAPNFSVSYILTGGNDAPTVTGVFSYVENNAPKEVAVIDNGVNRMEEAVAEVEEPVETEEQVETTEPEETADNTEQEQETVTQEETTQIDEPVAEETTTPEEPEVVEPETPAVTEPEEPTTADNTNDIPEPETGVTYKVQLMAAHRVVGERYFASRHGYNEDFSIENHAGWVKYTTGSHDQYKQARDSRERIKGRYNFRGPFVTAYNYGERITVQEALMISKQKWYK